MALLELRNVEAGYGEFRVLRNVSLRVEKGEIVALVGPNGAGKTTTLRTIMGMTTLYSGDIVFNGNSIKKLPTYRRVELGITMVPEGRRLFNSLTVYENLLAGAITKRAREKLEDSLEFVFTLFPRLKERRNQLAGTLSGGESQMLAIARALMARPQVLLLDEPSLGLAPKIVLTIFDVIKKLRDEGGVTILLVEQHVKNSLEIAERGYVMELGRIVLEGDAKKLLSDERLKKAYLII
ncbi:MAG: branched-chain amino acid ABC transporter ATP-binding protein [Desulfurococcales archaeon ex4484_42]|nr:MAG: branched-chain amino acid ABC transporter ATP-binding protein [Desulfurococcales archaeon ex4484_42]